MKNATIIPEIIRRDTGPDPCRLYLEVEIRPSHRAIRSKSRSNSLQNSIDSKSATNFAGIVAVKPGGRNLSNCQLRVDRERPLGPIYEETAFHVMLLFPQIQPCNRYIYIIDQASLVNMAGYWRSRGP